MNLFSRQNDGGNKTDKLSYELPDGLRNQIARLWEKGFGPDVSYHPGPAMAYQRIHDILCEEHQLLGLPQVSRHELPLRGVIAEYFFNIDVPKALDVVQVVFATMQGMVHRGIRNAWGDDVFALARFRTTDIINELNQRFAESNVGYRYVDGRIEKILQGPEPIPMKERLVAGEPARNLRKIKEMIGSATVVAIHDPYTTTGSLDTILTLADMGAKFSQSLYILGTAKTFSKTTEKQTFLNLLNNINTERNSSCQVRVYAAANKPHRRFLILDDGSIVTCGMSLNHIDKDEVLDHEPPGSANAIHDDQLFHQQWQTATPIK